MNERACDGVARIAWQTVAEVMARIQDDPARDWSLEDLARTSGYERHHFAHLFAEVCGEPPQKYVKRLRLEWAAYLLRDPVQPPVSEVAARLGYASAESFCRAFRRQFGVAPRPFRAQPYRHGAGEQPPVPHPVLGDDWPRGLAPGPEIVALGPLCGYTIRVRSFETTDVALGMAELFRFCPPNDSWQLGGLAQPWGWHTEDGERDFRCLRLVDAEAGPPPPPLLPWRLPRGWFARFDFDGAAADVPPACLWIINEWMLRAGLRAAYGPLISLGDISYGPQGGRLRLYAPVVVANPTQS